MVKKRNEQGPAEAQTQAQAVETKQARSTKVKLVLNELRGIAGKDYSAGSVVMSGELSIPGMTADDLNRGFAIKQIVAEEV